MMFTAIDHKKKSSVVRLGSEQPSRIFNNRQFHEIKPKKIPKHTNSFSPRTNINNVKFSLKINSLILAISTILTLILFFLTSEASYSADYTVNSYVNALRSAILFINILSVLIIYRYYSSVLEIRKAYREVSKGSTLLNDYVTKKRLLFEVLITVPFIPPSVSWSKQFSQIGITATLSIDDIIFLPALFRIYFLLKFLYDISPYNTFQSQFYLKLLNIHNHLGFALKSYVSINPFLSIGALATFGVFISGITLRVFEKSLPGTTYHTIWDQFYIISITQTTVGYGDTTPRTHIGRTVCVVSGIFGLFLYSYMVLSVTKFTQLYGKEKEFYDVVIYDYAKKTELRPIAIILIQKWWVLHLKRKSKAKRFHNYLAFLFYLKKFSFERAMLLQTKNESQEESINEFARISANKINGTLKYLKPLGEFKKNGKEILEDEFCISKKLVEIRNSIENNQITGQFESSRRGSVASISPSLKPHIKILGEKALRRMLTKTNISTGTSDN